MSTWIPEDIYTCPVCWLSVRGENRLRHLDYHASGGVVINMEAYEPTSIEVQSAGVEALIPDDEDLMDEPHGEVPPVVSMRRPNDPNVTYMD